MFKWYDSQMGYDGGNWLESTPTASSTYSILPAGKNTCAAFVGTVLADSVGYRNYAHWGMGQGGQPVNFPPNSGDWSAGNVSGFTNAGGPRIGDVISFDFPTHGHTGIYLGGGTYVSTSSDSPDNVQRDNGAILKGVPSSSSWNPFNVFNIIYNRYAK